MKKDHLKNILRSVYGFYKETPSLFIIVIVPVVEMAFKYFGWTPYNSHLIYKLLGIIYLFGAMSFMYKLMRERNKVHNDKMDSYRHVNEQLDEAKKRNEESLEIRMRAEETIVKAVEIRDLAIKDHETALKNKEEAIKNLEKSRKILEALKDTPDSPEKIVAIVEEVAKVL